MARMAIKYKKVLITNIWICDYAGSELNCLSLAKHFKSIGSYVEIATGKKCNPMYELFEKEGIPVINVFENEKTKYRKYDLIWSQHSQILDYLVFNCNVEAKKIIESSLSPFEPYETICSDH